MMQKITSHGLLFALALAALWLPLIWLLGAQWSISEQYNYGWAVPFLCLFLAYRRWRSHPQTSDLRPLPSHVGSAGDSPASFGVPPSDFSASSQSDTGSTGNLPVYLGNLPKNFPRSDLGLSAFQLFSFSAFCLLCLLLLPILILQEANPLWRFASYALVAEIIVITLTLIYFGGGWSAVRRFAFPVCFFLVAVPWPTPVEVTIIQSLTRLNTAAVVELMNFLGTPAMAHGNVIEVSTGLMGVDEACSGIRSTQAVFMLALFFGEFYGLRAGQRFGLIGGGLLIALLLNIVRTSILVGLAAHRGLSVSNQWHDATGISVLLGCFTLVWLLATWLQKKTSSQGSAGVSLNVPGATSDLRQLTTDLRFPSSDSGSTPAPGVTFGASPKGSTPTSDLRPLTSDVGSTGDSPNSSKLNSDRRPLTTEVRASQPFSVSAFPPVTVLVFSLISLLGSELWFHRHERKNIRNEHWAITLPGERAGFRESQPSAEVRSALRYDSAHTAAWKNADGLGWQFFHFRWNSGTSLNDRVRVHVAKSHRPENCLPAGGWKLLREFDPVRLDVNGVPLLFRAYEFAGRDSLFVFFAVHEDGTVAGSAGNMRESHRARWRAAWEGNRGLGQRVIEIAISGARDLSHAQSSLQSELPKIIHITPLTPAP